MNPKKVLLIDDDEAILEIISRSLDSLGYVVTTASTEKGLNDSLKLSRPDVILMDINLPWMDGIRICRDLRVSPATADIPVIIVTAHSDKKTFDEAILFGASDFISKPFEIAELNKKLNECISKSGSRKGNQK